MRRYSTAALAIFIALVFVAYMVSYTVSYNETAVVTRFGKAGENAVVTDPGLHFKLPWPIDRVHTYPKQVQVLQDNPEQILLPDGNTVIVNMSVAWTISNPLDFFKSLRTIDEENGANDTLRSLMQNLRSVITQYRFDQLVNPDPTKVQMAQLEAEVAAEFQAQIDAIQPSYGITIERVSMGRLLYTESTATKVNERMSATQSALAAVILTEGTAEAGTITSEAQAAREIILAFTGEVAQQIRTVGEDEVAEFMARFAQTEEDQDLAIFLRQIEAAERILGNRSTLVIDVSQLNPFNVYFMGPGQPGDISRLGAAAEPASSRPSPLRPDVAETTTTSPEAGQ
ncbi:MAG: SPFH domain-containing protein [Phycisphaerales bacterium JB063]